MDGDLEVWNQVIWVTTLTNWVRKQNQRVSFGVGFFKAIIDQVAQHFADFKSERIIIIASIYFVLVEFKKKGGGLGHAYLFSENINGNNAICQMRFSFSHNRCSHEMDLFPLFSCCCNR